MHASLAQLQRLNQHKICLIVQDKQALSKGGPCGWNRDWDQQETGAVPPQCPSQQAKGNGVYSFVISMVFSILYDFCMSVKCSKQASYLANPQDGFSIHIETIMCMLDVCNFVLDSSTCGCRWKMLWEQGTSCTLASSMKSTVAAVRSSSVMVTLTQAAHGRPPTRSAVQSLLQPVACLSSFVCCHQHCCKSGLCR